MRNKNPIMENGVCLAVSNCKSCWDTGSKLAFISNSIPDYLDAEWLKAIDHVVLNGPWESREYCLKNRQFVVARVIRYRKELLPILNSALGIDYGERAWGFLLDSWLMHFTSVIYDRVNKLENACSQLDNVYLICFREDIPLAQTTHDFVHNCLNDRFNQQLLGDIATALGIRVERCVDYLPGNDLLPVGIAKKGLKHKAYLVVTKLLRPVLGWWVKFQMPLVILDGYFPFVKTILVFLRSMGKVLIVPSQSLLEKQPEFREKKSLRMLLKVTEEDRFDLVANKLFLKNFPVSLLEGLKNYSEKVSELGVIPVLGAATNFHYNEEYKILASRVIENGNKIIGFQHGGNYNFEENELFCAGYFEKMNADKFYQWKVKSLVGKYLPTAKLANLSRCKETRKERNGFVDILFIFGDSGRFIFRCGTYNSDEFIGYLAAQQNFYMGLNENVAKHFLLRPSQLVSGWRYKERWLDLTRGEIRFDPNREFRDSLTSCRIFVTDHISTTWLEAFYMGVPVLLFFDIEDYFVLAEVKSLFEDLRSVGVFHPSAESAASFLNEKYEIIEEWWELPETKEAVGKIRNYFFTDSGSLAKDWTRELVTLRHKAQNGELKL